MLGKTIAHYEVTAKLGAGGMGEVYQALDKKLGRKVAIKILRQDYLVDSGARDRLLREARSAAALNHPNICTVHEVGDFEGQAYIVMELVEGQPLGELIPPTGLPGESILRFGRQIAEALAHAHERGLVHRDLKPSNVVVTPQGHAKVLDFGLAKRQSPVEENMETESLQTLTMPGTTVGTLAYMAPEQLRGEPASERSDVWAFGVMLHEMASGKRPFRGRTSFELSAAILTEATPQLPSQTPPEIKAVIGRCLAREPARRYARGGEIVAAMETQQGALGGAPSSPALSLRRSPALKIWKNLAVAAVLILAVWNIKAMWPRLIGSGAKPIASLAVLPLENLSADSGQEYLASGVQEALITDLGKISGLQRVVPRGATKRFRESNRPLAEIARELGVDALVTGSVLRSGNRVQVSVHLIRPDTEEQIWGDRYEKEMRDVLILQNEIVSAITRGIHLKLSASESRQLTTDRTVNPAAYDAFLQGKFFLNKFTPEGFERGLALLRQAVEKDPGNAQAHGHLALAYALVGHDIIPDAFVQAKAAARKAIELDPNSAEAYEALAESTLYFDWKDWPQVEGNFKKALAANPDLAIGHRNYSWYLNLMGRGPEGIAEIKRAVALDPTVALFEMDLGFQYWDARQPELAMEHARKALELDPNFPWAHLLLTLVHSEAGRHAEAIAAGEKAAQVEPAFRFGLAMAYARAGRKDMARRNALEVQKHPSPLADFGLAEYYSVIGDYPEALRWLQRSLEGHFSLTAWLRSKDSGLQRPFLPFRNDPQYQALLSRMNLKE